MQHQHLPISLRHHLRVLGSCPQNWDAVELVLSCKGLTGHLIDGGDKNNVQVLLTGRRPSVALTDLAYGPHLLLLYCYYLASAWYLLCCCPCKRLSNLLAAPIQVLPQSGVQVLAKTARVEPVGDPPAHGSMCAHHQAPLHNALIQFTGRCKVGSCAAAEEQLHPHMVIKIYSCSQPAQHGQRLAAC